MAIINTTTSASLGRYVTLAAEYYQPQFVSAESRLKKIQSQTIPLKRCTQTQFPITYGVLKPREVESGNFRLARIQNSDALFMFGDELPPISSVQFNEYARSEVREGDIVIAIGGYIGPLGIISRADGCRLNINRHLARVSPNSGIVDRYYLAAFLASGTSQLLLTREIRGAVQAGVNIADLKLHPVFIPAIANQLEIGELMRGAEKALENSKDAYSHAKQILDSELGLEKFSFTKPLSYTADASEVAESFRTDAEFYNPVAKKIMKVIESIPHTRLSSSFTVKNGFPWKSEKFLPDNSGDPVVRIRNIRPSHTNPRDLTSLIPEYARLIGAEKARAGDIVVGMDGIKYFYASVLTGSCYVNQRVAHLTGNPGAKISSEFATFIINSPLGQAQLMRDMTVATTVGHITNRDIRRLVIPTVSQKFHDRVTELVQQSISGIEESKRLLEEAKNRVEKLIEEAVRS